MYAVSVETNPEEESSDSSRLEKDDRWLLAKRIAASSTFSRSVRLSHLLTYLCEWHLLNPGAPLTEQQIAAEVFERRGSFDPAADTIVRSHMLRLRQKLETYFTEEGRHEELRISIPKGGYVPAFERIASAGPPAQVLPQAGLEAAQHDTVEIARLEAVRRRLVAICALLGILCVVLIVVLSLKSSWGGRKDAGVEPPGKRHLWGSLFAGKSPTVLVSADSGLAMLHGLTQRNSTLAEYVARDFSKELNPDMDMRPEVALSIANRRYTSFVDLELFDRLTHLPEALATDYRIRFARDIHADDLKSANVILSGSQDANPWIELFEPQMNFVLRDDLSHGVRAFINRKPRAGEQDIYNSAEFEYGVLAFLPNLSGTGNALLIEGTSVAGTEAISDFLFEDSTFEPFLEKISRKDGSIPPFEILLESRGVNGSASRSQIVAYRVH
jgi:hypothetical protein